MGDDVFLTAPTSGNVPQLSPTAQVFKPKFTPRAAPPRANRTHAFAPSHGTKVVGLDYYPSKNIVPNANNPGVRSLLQDSIPDSKPKSLADMQAPVLQARDPRSYIKPIGGTLDTDIEVYLDRLGVWNISHMDFMMNASGKYINDVHFTEGVFSTDENAVRAFAVIGVPADFRSRRIAEAFKVPFPLTTSMSLTLTLASSRTSLRSRPSMLLKLLVVASSPSPSRTFVIRRRHGTLLPS